ncbi:MAG: ROK family transcriptional regulator [Bacteroidota bacterium]
MWEVINQRSLLIREPNEVRVLRLVRDSGEISRIEIAKACNLNKAYVSELVAKLIQTGFLEETGKVEANDKVGRKRMLLRFLPLAGLVAGVDIGMTHATIVLTDLNAAVLRKKTFFYSLETPAKKVLSNVVDTITSLLVETNDSQSTLVGIGVGVQGLIDYKTNTLMVSYNKKSWEGESLSAELETHFKVPMYVENDVKAMTLGEYLLGSAKGIKNLVYLFIGDGLGAGIMINGHLHRGFTSSAGEIGYTELEPASHYKEQFPFLYNGQSIFGQILTDTNIVESYRRNSVGHAEEKISVETVADKAKNGDSTARQIIIECSSLLSSLCINLINTLNPELIIIGGKLSQCYPKIIDLVQETIHKDLLSVPAEAVMVRAATRGEEAVALGATGLVLYEMFEPLHTISLNASRRYSFVRPSTSIAD